MGIRSVCQSVRLPNACSVTKRNIRLLIYQHHMKQRPLQPFFDSNSSCRGRSPSTWNSGWNWPTPFKTPSFLHAGFVQNSDCGFPDFSWTKLLLFSRLFEALCSSLCEQRTLQNWLLNAEISYTMYSSIRNTEWDSNFWTLNFRCIGNQQCNRHLHFPGQHYSFQGFFQTFPYLWSFSRLFKALKISTLNSRTFHTFSESVRTLYMLLLRRA